MRHWPFCVRYWQRGDSEVLGTGCVFILSSMGGGYPPVDFVRADSKEVSGGISVRADSKGVRTGEGATRGRTWRERAETKRVRANHGYSAEEGEKVEWLSLVRCCCREFTVHDSVSYHICQQNSHSELVSI